MNPQRVQIKIAEECSGLRLDKAIQQSLCLSIDPKATTFGQISVKQIKKLIEAGGVTHCGQPMFKASYKAQVNEVYDCELSQLQIISSTPMQQKTKAMIDHRQIEFNQTTMIHAQHRKNKEYWTQVWASSLAYAQSNRSGQSSRSGQSPSAMPFELIYMDEQILVVNKISDLPTAPTIDPKRLTLFHYILAYLSQLQRKQGLIATQEMPYLRNIHRLDKATSGLVICSLTPQASKDLAYVFEKRQIDKRYHLICHRPKSGPLFEFIKKQASVANAESVFSFEAYMQAKDKSKNSKSNSSSQNKRSSHDLPDNEYGKIKGKKLWQVVKTNGLYSRTDFRILSLSDQYVYLEAQLHTGRTHQIRVHTQALNAPIVGDPWYGKIEEKSKRLYLHAYSLEILSNPIDTYTHAPKLIAEIPTDFLHDFPHLFL